MTDRIEEIRKRCEAYFGTTLKSNYAECGDIPYLLSVIKQQKQDAIDLDLLWRRLMAITKVRNKLIGWQDKDANKIESHIERFREKLDIPPESIVRLAGTEETEPQKTVEIEYKTLRFLVFELMMLEAITNSRGAELLGMRLFDLREQFNSWLYDEVKA